MISFAIGLIVGVCAAVLGIALGRAGARGDRDIDSVLSPENRQEPTQEPPGSSAESQQGTEATLPRGTVCRDPVKNGAAFDRWVTMSICAWQSDRRAMAEHLARRWWKLMELRNRWPVRMTTWEQEQALGTPVCEDLIESMEMFLLGREWEPLSPVGAVWDDPPKKYQDMKTPAEAGEGEG